MTQPDSGPLPSGLGDVRHHPPIYAGPPAPRAAGPAWPNVFGVIAIVMGSLGLLGLCSLATPLWTSIFQSMPQPTSGPNPFATMEKWQTYVMILGFAQAVMGAVALWAGILLMKR